MGLLSIVVETLRASGGGRRSLHLVSDNNRRLCMILRQIFPFFDTGETLERFTVCSVVLVDYHV